jgi:RNA polymerase sigma-70 factor, ECF subfamily
MAHPDSRKREEFAEWALPHMDHVYTAGVYLTRNEDEAEDLLQETFLRAYRFWHQFTPGTNCRAWLITILHNTFKNRYRERYREQQAIEFDEAAVEVDDATRADMQRADPESIVLSQLLDAEVQEALQRLPLPFLEVVLMVDIQEMSYEEAAAATGSPIGTVRSRLSRARRMLHTALARYAQERGVRRGGTYALRRVP